MSQSLRELGLDFVAESNWERALAIFAEAVRRNPADHRARMLAARCFAKLGATERAVTTLHACATFESLIKQYPAIREYLEGLSDRRLKQIGEAMRPVEILDAHEQVVDE